METMFSKHVPLRGSYKTAPMAKSVKRINKDDVASVTVKLRAKNNLPDLLNPGLSKDFTAFSRADFQRSFGVDNQDVQKVEDFAFHYGLTIKSTNSSISSIELQGTLQQIEEAFNVELSCY